MDLSNILISHIVLPNPSPKAITMFKQIFRYGLSSLAILAIQAHAEPITYKDLVNRLTDMEYLATLPAKGETMAQFSSYDRRSKYDEKSGKYLQWDANDDGRGYIRMENGEEVFAEMNGPGCIWRIWSADPTGQGKIRIVIDGLEIFHDRFQNLFNGSVNGFHFPNLTYVASRGWNSYVPIPYQKSCKITAEPGWGRYFHFNYATYPQGTSVPSFTLPMPPQDIALLKAANEKLAAKLPPPADLSTFKLTPSQTVTLFEKDSPAAITGWTLKLKLPEDVEARRALLMNLVVQINWDGNGKPAVWAPLDAFFGTQPGVNPFTTYPTGVEEDGTFWCRWFMPFQSARVTLLNRGDETVECASAFQTAALSQPLENYGRFHAKWHGDDPEPLPEPERQAIDWRVLHTSGRGRWCGMMLHVWNPLGAWWGEGDEKIYIDGEKFPSTFGTGSEDYFGYAWCHPGLFTKPYHAQSISENNAGHVSVNRFHISDQIPFQNGIEADIEKYFPNSRPTRYWAIAYWYLSPDGIDTYAPIAALPDYPMPDVWVKGALECENLHVLSCTGGRHSRQEMHGFLPVDGSKPLHSWSGLAQFFWQHGKPGDFLEFAVPVEKSDDYSLEIQITKARDYANLQLWLDGKRIGPEIDAYSPNVIASGPIPYGTVHLEPGTHVVKFEIIGKNDQSSNYFAGLDYILLKPDKP